MQTVPELRLGRALIAWAFGASALVVQTEYLRGAMVVSDGGTLAAGAALAAWLTVICAGSLAGTLLDRFVAHPRRALCGAGILALPSAVFLLFYLVSFRQSAGLNPGLIAPPSAVFTRCLVACLPYCFCIGLSFPLISRFTSPEQEKTPAFSAGRLLGEVWAAEALGSFVAGVGFTFLLAGHTSPASNVLFFGALPSLAVLAACLKRPAAVWIAAGATLCALLPIYLFQPLSGRLADLEWQALGAPGRKVSAQWGRYGSLILAESEGQHTLFENGTPRAVFPDSYTDLTLAALILCQDPDIKRISTTGPCCGGLAQTLLRAGAGSVRAVYPDSRVEELITGHVPDSLRLALGGGRYSYVSTDARAWLGRQLLNVGGANPAGAEALFVDLQGPSRMETARYYTVDFFRLAALSLAPGGGLLVLRLPYSASYAPGPRLDLAASIWASLGHVFRCRALAAGATELFFFATDRDTVLSEDPACLMRRIESAEQAAPGFSRYFILPYFETARVEAVRAELETGSSEVAENTDRHPVAWFQSMRLNLRLSGNAQESRLEKALGRVSEMNSVHRVLIAAVPVLCCLALLGALALRGRRRACQAGALLSLALAGMVSLGGMVILQYTCQLVFGALFQQAGMLTAVFMLAMALGSHFSARINARGLLGRNRLVLSLAALAVCPLLIAVLPPVLGPLYVSGNLPGVMSYAVFYMAVALTGFCGGAVFPAAAAEFRPGGLSARTGADAGLLNAADHCGAALGAFLTGVAALPAWGPLSTSYALAAALACSVMFWIWLSQRDLRN